MKRIMKTASLILVSGMLLLNGCGSKEAEAISTSAASQEAYFQEGSRPEVEAEVTATPEPTKTPIVTTEPKEEEAIPEETPAAEEVAALSAEEVIPEETQKENGHVIVLDPGHSSVIPDGTVPIGPGAEEQKAADAIGTSGCVTGIPEYELTMDMALLLKTELEERGYQVLLTREDSVTTHDCIERAEVANAADADCLIRIHADGSENSGASGAETICITAANPYAAEMYAASRLLSDSVINAYCQETGIGSRGVWETDTMTGNNWSKVPCTLIEMGFMTNPEEDQLMASPDFRVLMVNGIANGIDGYFAAQDF